jgi:hypothetical protein
MQNNPDTTDINWDRVEFELKLMKRIEELERQVAELRGVTSQLRIYGALIGGPCNAN